MNYIELHQEYYFLIREESKFRQLVEAMSEGLEVGLVEV